MSANSDHQERSVSKNPFAGTIPEVNLYDHLRERAERRESIRRRNIRRGVFGELFPPRKKRRRRRIN